MATAVLKAVRTCQGCATDLTGTHGRRKWCSEACRKATLYSGRCEDCGLPTDGSNGKAKAPKKCAICSWSRNAERNAEVVSRFNEGEPYWFIAQEMGIPQTTVSGVVQQERERGRDVALHRLGGGATEREARHRNMVALRRNGLTDDEIAVEVGMSSANSVNKTFQYLRRVKGWDVPQLRSVAA